MSHFISNTKLLWTWLLPSWLDSSLERHTPNAPPTGYTKSSNHLYFSTFHRLALNFNQVISSIQLPAPACQLPTLSSVPHLVFISPGKSFLPSCSSWSYSIMDIMLICLPSPYSLEPISKQSLALSRCLLNNTATPFPAWLVDLRVSIS